MSWWELGAAASAIHAAAAARDPAVTGNVLAGIGWATVEGERAIRELDQLLGPAPWHPATRDELLGAAAWMRAEPANPSTMLVVLEPDTEGRLAASLARWGEGVLAVYVRPPAADDVEPPAQPGTAPGSGPLGPGRLVAGAPAWGPHVVVLGGASR